MIIFAGVHQQRHYRRSYADAMHRPGDGDAMYRRSDVKTSQKTVLWRYKMQYTETFKEIRTQSGYPYNIFIVGFMGTGKTTLSGFLKKHTGIEELDMDSTIEKQQGMTISKIFEEKGEPYFRSLETKLLVELQSKSGLLVSCGGGVVLREENVAEMKKSGLVVLLTAKPETILERVKNNDDRPLLRGNKNVPFIENLLNQRMPKYMAAADLIVETDGRKKEDIAEELCRKLLERL